MNIPDFTNGLFETLGGLFIWLNVYRTYQAKVVKGVSIITTIFMSAWGYWNLYYYPHLNQWLSFAGGIMIVLGNTAWLYSMIYYWPRDKERTCCGCDIRFVGRDGYCGDCRAERDEWA